MRMMALLMATAASVTATAAPAAAHDASRMVASPRNTHNLNPGRRMVHGDQKGAERPSFSDAKWQMVTLPNAFNERELHRTLPLYAGLGTTGQ
ncbi:hypothetical protein ACX0GZ_13300 [Sphingomonas aestuarii]